LFENNHLIDGIIICDSLYKMNSGDLYIEILMTLYKE